MKWLWEALRLVQVEHTLFALPFAFSGAILAQRAIPPWSVLGWIFLAMLGARSAAMAFNRIVDRRIDAVNPRTCERGIPAGRFSLVSAWVVVGVSAMLLIFAAGMLNPLAFVLSPVALAAVLSYSVCKRFTWLSHFFLGLCLACAPVGGWIAVTGSLSLVPLLLGSTVLFWVAGFDIIYACQDVEFDRIRGLHSIPGRFGCRRALLLSAFLHLISFFFLLTIFSLASLGPWFFAGVIVIALLLLYEHWVVGPTDLSHINQAFFVVNGLISFSLLIFLLLDLWL